LLAGLDDEPGGWRVCALAFLEAQAWRWQFSRLAAEPILAQLAAHAPKSPLARGSFWVRSLAMAAGLIVAFALGTRYSGDLPTSEGIAGKPPRRQQLAALAPTPENDDSPWQTLTLLPAEGGSHEPLELRVANTANSEGEGAALGPLVLPAILLHQFE